VGGINALGRKGFCASPEKEENKRDVLMIDYEKQEGAGVGGRRDQSPVEGGMTEDPLLRVESDPILEDGGVLERSYETVGAPIHTLLSLSIYTGGRGFTGS